MENKEFDKPLGKWIEETEQIENVVRTFDPETKKLKEETVLEDKKVKVIYEKTSIDDIFCHPFTHEFILIDSHKYIIKCKKCPLHKFISVGNEYIDKEGKVRARSNDAVIA